VLATMPVGDFGAPTDLGFTRDRGSESRSY